MARRTKRSSRDGEVALQPEVVLIDDEPSTADTFDAKAHEKVAKAIAELVKGEPGGRVIGLEGSWGSGKSTIVRLASQYLQATESGEHLPDTRVIAFDAWSHQGDPLRRTFLEKLLDDLVAANWLPDALASELREKLAGKTATVHTTSTQRLSFEGRLTAAAAVLVPLGVVLVQNHFHSHHGFALLVGLVLAVAPLLVVAGFAVAHGIGVLVGGRKATAGRWRRRLAKVQPFSFFAKEQHTDTMTDEIRRGDPTSVEFEQFFSMALDQGVTNGRRLLLVLDNLDRVEEEDAKSILATMQTFTGSRTRAGSSWAPRVWTLIPYDPGGLDRLWHSGQVLPQDTEQGEPGDDTIRGQENTRPLATSTAAAFVEKVFQVRFETPPLVLSDWRGHLRRLLHQAFPNVRDHDFEPVIRLRGLYPALQPTGLTATEAPTPRQLKQFVNQIGAIRRLRDDVALVHMAYYVLLRQDQVMITAGLVTNTLPHPELGYLFGESIREDLAALRYGTTQALAQQIMLRGALEGAFAKLDSSMVEELKDRAGFAETLDSLQLSALNGGVELTRAVAVLNASGALDLPLVQAWLEDALYPVARSTDTWVLDGRESGIGLATLLDGLSTGDDGALSLSLARLVPEAREPDSDGSRQLAGLAGLADELARLGRDPSSLRGRLEIPAERLTRSVAFFGTQVHRTESNGMLELSATPVEVAEAVVASATGDAHRDAEMALETLMIGRPERVSIESVGTGCLKWLTESEPSSQEPLAAVLRLIDRARREGGLAEALGGAADDGTLMDVVAVATRNDWNAEGAAASMLHLVVRPTMEEVEVLRQSALGMQSVRQALADPSTETSLTAAQLGWLKDHATEAFGVLMRIGEAGSSQAWVDRQLTDLFEASALVTSADEYISSWDYLANVLGDAGFTGYTRGVLDDAASRAQIIDRCDDPVLIAVALRASSLGEEAQYAADLDAWASKTVKAASTDQWDAALQSPAEDDALLEIALGLSGTKDAPSDPAGLKDALHRHFQALANGEAVWQPDGETFAKLANLLGKAARGVLASQLCASLEGKDGQIGTGVFSTYGPFLGGEEGFRKHEKLPNIVERLVAHDDLGAIEWFVELATSHPDTFAPEGREAEIGNLSRKVSEKLLEAGEDASEELTGLASLLPGQA